MKVKRIVKQWRYPEASESELVRSTSQVVSQLVKRLKENTKLMKFDASADEIRQGEDDSYTFSDYLIAALVASIPLLARRIYQFNSKQWLIIAMYYGGSKVESVALLKALGANEKEQWYNLKYELWRAQTEATYRKLTRDIISDWSSVVRSESLKGSTEKQVEEVLSQRYKVYTSWAGSRSRGIVHSWNSMLMRQRLEDAKVDSYIWRGQLDERERLKHLRWEGKEIGVETDHVFPGEEWGCRCWAQPQWKKTGKQ